MAETAATYDCGKERTGYNDALATVVRINDQLQRQEGKPLLPGLRVTLFRTSELILRIDREAVVAGHRNCLGETACLVALTQLAESAVEAPEAVAQ